MFVSIVFCSSFSRYPSTFLEEEFRKFFNDQLSPTSFLSFIQNEEHFIIMRRKLFSQAITQLLIMATNLSTHGLTNEARSALEEPINTTSVTAESKKKAEYDNTLFVHHSYEKRFRSMKRDLHTIHKDLLDQSANKSAKMIVGTRNRRSACHELIRKRPKPSLLNDRQRQSKRSIDSILIRSMSLLFLLNQRNRRKLE